MTTALITSTNPGFSPAANPRTWDHCDNCWEPDVAPAPRSFAHIVIFMDNGQLIASPECGQHRFDLPMAGHLALAGVRIATGNSGFCQLLDPEQLNRAVAALNAAGAGVTVEQS